MKNKLLVISFLIVLMFTGCGKKDTEPVVSEVVEETEPVAEIEPVEEVETTEPEETIAVEEEIQQQEDVEVDGEVVGGSTLTQEEIDELKASATSSGDQYSLTLYEEVTKNGTYTDEYGRTFNKVVGKPDGSWRRMTDAEAQAIIAQGEDAEGYYAAEAELEGTSWRYMEGRTGTIYYDYYAWLDSDASKPADTGSDYKDGEDLKRDNPELYDRLMKFDR